MPLTLRTTRRLLWAATGLVATAIPAVWWWGRPSTSETTIAAFAGSVTGSNPQTDEDNERRAHTLADLVAAAERPLRQPLYDPPPAVVVKPPPPPLRLTLLGTVMEAGRSRALIRSAAGEVAMHPEGAVIDGATLQSIEPDTVVVRYHDQELTLQPQH